MFVGGTLIIFTTVLLLDVLPMASIFNSVYMHSLYTLLLDALLDVHIYLNPRDGGGTAYIHYYWMHYWMYIYTLTLKDGGGTAYIHYYWMNYWMYMWQSRVEIEGYSVAYFDRIAAFKAPYR